ncbi:Iaa20p [Asimina triloba]
MRRHRHSSSSSSSSTDSNIHPSPLSSASSPSILKRDLSTDLRLGLSISTVHHHYNASNSRDERYDWPPIKPLLRSTLAERGNQCERPTFFVKVYMEGLPIGRKLDLFAHDGYDSLVRTLRRMFGPDFTQVPSDHSHVLTFEDKEGDWMMVGDVPWE